MYFYTFTLLMNACLAGIAYLETVKRCLLSVNDQITVILLRYEI